MSERGTHPALELSHTTMSEEDALRFLDGHRIRLGSRTMVTLMDEPAPALPRVEDISIPGPAGAIPARVYAASTGGAPPPTVVYFHGGG